jgi:hypothetical protein
MYRLGANYCRPAQIARAVSEETIVVSLRLLLETQQLRLEKQRPLIDSRGYTTKLLWASSIFLLWRVSAGRH